MEAISDAAKQRGQRLKKFREHLELEQKDLAELFDTSQVTISRYETGQRSVPEEYIRLMNSKYKLSYDFYYGGKLPMRTVEVKESITTNLSDIKRDNAQMEWRIYELERQVKALIKELSELKKGV